MVERAEVSIESVESQDARCAQVEVLLLEHHEAMSCLDVEDCVQLVLGLIREGAMLDDALRRKSCADPQWPCKDVYGRLNAHLFRVENLASRALSFGRCFRDKGFEVRGLDILETELADLRWMIRPESFDWNFLSEPLVQAFDEHRRGETEPLLPLPE